MRSIAFAVSVASVAILGCGGSTDPNTGGGTPATLMITAGSGQTFRINANVPVRPAVKVTDSQGRAVANVNVTFAVAAGGGSVAGQTVTTGSDGVATVGNWTLGPAVGSQSLTASVATPGVTPATITATGRLPYWTVAVYMAADNNLAFSGVQDIEEMEAASRDPEVQVVVQAEFSAANLAQYGCASAACINRPNWNTFRYVLPSLAASRIGPDGPATDIGNRDMSSPGDLADFIQWARATAPSEHLVLVPWNHGGGYTGLLQDETSGGLMSMAQFRTALQTAGGPPIDVIDFDMCLMGAYETLVTMQGLANYVVFSEELVPGAGNDYTRLLEGLNEVSDENGASAASAIADAFHASFGGHPSSTTISAYGMTAFSAFDQALGALATRLKNDLPTYGSHISQAASGVQRFDLAELADVLNFADSLEARIADPSVRSDIATLRSAGAATNFRLRNWYRNGTAPGLSGTSDVSRARGLHVFLPDVTAAPVLGDNGRRSLGSYLGTFGTTAWGQFVEAYLGSPATYNVTDLGTNRLDTYVIWTNAAGVDIDLWVLEPDGNVASPYFGSISPNGTLTADSYLTGVPVEGYHTNRFVQNGTYVWYAMLASDPQAVEPRVDFVYRYGSDPFVSVFGAGPYPQLSKAVSVFADPTPTFAEADASAYSDLVPLATATFGAPGLLGSAKSVGTPVRTLTRAALPRIESARTAVSHGPGNGSSLSLRVASRAHRPTSRQIETMRALLEQRRAGVRPPSAAGLTSIKAPRHLTQRMTP